MLYSFQPVSRVEHVIQVWSVRILSPPRHCDWFRDRCVTQAGLITIIPDTFDSAIEKEVLSTAIFALCEKSLP